MAVEAINISNTVNQSVSMDGNQVRDTQKVKPKVMPNIKPKVKARPLSKPVHADEQEDIRDTDNAIDNEKKIKQTVSDINSKIRQSKSQVEFTYHKSINRVSIKVVDTETQETIREIPPEETIEMIEKMWEIAGLFMDKKL